jgi:Family of unknown function (DUF5991)
MCEHILDIILNMKNTQKGSTSITVLILIMVGIGLISMYYLSNKKQTGKTGLYTATTTSIVSEIKPQANTEEIYTFSEFVEPNQNMIYSLKKLSDINYELQIDGFQTMLEIKAQSKMKGHDSFDLVFDSYIGTNNTPNIFKKGDVLFNATGGSTDNTIIILKWDILKPLDPQNEKTAVFIRK